MRYEFIDKTIFFPEQGILAVGDLHLGYEHMLRDMGVNLPETQIKDVIENLENIFSEIKKKKYVMKKIILLGDIKHFFGYNSKEKSILGKFFKFLKTHFKEKDIILIKGNHDKLDYFGKKMKNYYISKELAFIHGHQAFPEIFDKKVKKIIMSHIHPSIILSEKTKIKKEKYKCFLVGNYKKKEIIILPSFLEITDGIPINEYDEYYKKYFSIIPKKTILNSNVFIVGEDRVYNFGKAKNIS